jgi:hypothetical protein
MRRNKRWVKSGHKVSISTSCAVARPSCTISGFNGQHGTAAIMAKMPSGPPSKVSA